MLKQKSLLIGLLSVFILSFANIGYSQNTTKINLSLNNSTLLELMNLIEGQTEFTFVYDNSVSLTQKISIEAKDETIQSILNKAFTSKGISFEISGTQIILRQKDDLQKRKISGKVTDLNNEPLAGTTIFVSGTKITSVSDKNGNFTIEVPNDKVTIEFNYLGFISQRIIAGNRAYVEVKLSEDNKLLEEVVLVGYGSQKKKDLTSAISVLGSKEMANQTISNAASVLQGRLTGVRVTASGAPGASPDIRIRGTGSISSTGPLYVVDGVMVDEISYLGPNDIESMTILKDASASAIYGVRAANGVILVSTKKGVVGDKVRISFSSYAGLKKVSNVQQMTNSTEYVTMFNEIMDFNGTPTQKIDAASFPNSTNWFNEIFEDNWTNSQDINISGGSDKTSFTIGFNHLKDDGIIKSNQYEKISIRSQYEVHYNKNIKTGLNLVITTTKSNPYPGNLLTTTYQTVPMLSPTNSDGTFSDPAKIGTWTPPAGNRNPAALLFYNHQWNNSLKAVGSFFVDVNFLKYFNIRSTVGVNPSFGKSVVFTPVYAVGTSIQKNDKNTISKSNSNNSSSSWDNTLSFEKSFNNDHNLKAMVGYSYREQTSDWLNAGAENIINIPSITQNYLFLTIGKGTGYAVNATDGGSKSVQLGFLGRVNYDYKHKYLVNLTMRADASSMFPADNRWGYFPSVGLGWILSEEKFIQDLNIINFLKLRAGWGMLGNDKIPSNIYTPVVSNGTLVIFGPTQNSGTGAINPSTTINRVFNPNLRWEVVNETNIGVDAKMFNSRFSTTIDWYYKLTQDAVFPVTTIGSSGLSGSGVWGNYANILNTGIELSFGWEDKVGDLGYYLNVNGTYNKNEVTAINAAGAAYIDAGDSGNNITPLTRTTVGRPVGEFYGYKVIGVFQNQAEVDAYPHIANAKPGTLKFEDVNGDNLIDAKDRTRIGNPNPPIMYGFGFGLNYKNFDFSMFCQGVLGNKIFNENRLLMSLTNQFDKAFYDNRWTGEGTSNTYPTPKVLVGDPRSYVNSFYVEDGSYFRIKTIQIGYNLPSRILDKISVKNVRLYLNAENPLTVFKYNGFSPEVASSSPLLTGINNGVYPLSSVYSMGINLTF